MSQFYSDPSRESEKYALPNAETFEVQSWNGCPLCQESDEDSPFIYGSPDMLDDHKANHRGWYYQYCFPGCLPDSMALGPYATEQEAIAACREECAE